MTSTWGAVGDGAGFVESMYRIDLDGGAWLDGLWRGMAPLTPGGTLVAGRYTWHAARRDFRLVDMTGSDAQAVAHLRGSAARVESSSLTETIGAPTRVYTTVGALGGRLGHDAMSAIMKELGVTDILNVAGWVDGGETRDGVCISAASLTDVVPMAGAAGAAWERFAAHLGAAVRLRHADGKASSVECVLSADGRVLDAEGAARPALARDALRRAAVAIERARLRERRTDIAGLLDAWRAIYERRWTLVEKVESDGRRILLARVNPPETMARKIGSKVENQIAALLVQGVSQKAIAYELERSPSTISLHVARMARRLGVASPAELVVQLQKPGPGDDSPRPAQSARRRSGA